MQREMVNWEYEMAPRALTPGPWPNLLQRSDMEHPTCSLPECDRPRRTRGWCAIHYNKWRKHGTLASLRPTRAEAFWARVEKFDGCWLWTGATNGRYPVFSLGGRGNQGYAHRYSYELNVGPIPDGLQIDHLCRTPMCVRPDHLEPVTHVENMRRRRAETCGRGHAMTGDNVWTNGRNRKCRTCQAIRWAAYTRKPRHRHNFREECPQCRAA